MKAKLGDQEIPITMGICFHYILSREIKHSTERQGAGRSPFVIRSALVPLSASQCVTVLSVQSGLGVFLEDGTGFSDFACQVPYKPGLSYLSKCFLPLQLSK